MLKIGSFFYSYRKKKKKGGSTPEKKKKRKRELKIRETKNERNSPRFPSLPFAKPAKRN